MYRLFYPTLVLVTLAALAALAVPRDGSQPQPSVLGGAAHAQSTITRPEPYDQRSVLPFDPTAMSQGPAPPVMATRPESWPGGPPSQRDAAPPPRSAAATQLLPPTRPGDAQLYPPATPPPAYAQFAQREARRPASAQEQAALPEIKHADDFYTSVMEGAKIVARVGNEVILANEIIGDVDEILADNADKIPPGERETIRRQLIQQRLKAAIESKLLVVDARRKVPDANLPKIMDHLGESFESQELSQLERRAGVQTRAELDAKLRQRGTSLDRFKRNWMEQQLAGGWLHQQVKTESKHVTHEEMLKYFYEHLAEYDYPAKVRWEQLMVRLDKDLSRDAAKRKLEQMGNDVLRGASLSDVAKAHSDGPTASDGGQFDWTSRNSLASRALDEAIFALPVGRLSQILEDERGLYIVRVIERTDAGRKSFADVQSDIKKAIEQQRDGAGRSQRLEYMARLKREIPVWTVFDGTVTGDAKQAGYQSSADSSSDRTGPMGPSDRNEPPDRYSHREPTTPAPPMRR